MNSKILINATQKEELRVAIIKEKNKLDDLYIEHIGVEQKKANIYKGVITRLEPSLGAAFVNYGADRHGFLPLKEIDKTYFLQEIKSPFSQLNIKELLKEGQELIVQVDKDEIRNKGAALTTHIILVGAYLVLTVNDPRAGGISRRIEGDEREELKEILKNLPIPPKMGIIIRTAGVGKTLEELKWDLDSLLNYWQAIQNASNERSAPFLIHRESDVVIRTIRDYLRSDIGEIIADTPEVYNTVKEYLLQVRPEFVNIINLYQNKVPLFSHFQIEKQIESAYQRTVTLPSGGSIVIDHTEALVTIDVNSARATGGRDIEETALNTNLEAAEEIARQLRIRDLGGLIVIDFIDMLSLQNQRNVINKLRTALQSDRARVRFGNITKFGLLEMSRQRIRPPLTGAIHSPCPRCDGQGTIRSISSIALSIIRLLEEEAGNERIAQIQAHVPVDLATYLLNEKREAISEIECRYKIRILIIPNPQLRTPKYKIKCLTKSDLPHNEKEVESYKLIEIPKLEIPLIGTAPVPTKFEEPAIKPQITQAPVRVLPKRKNRLLGFIKGLFSSLKSSENHKLVKPENDTPKRTNFYKNRRRPNYRPYSHRNNPKSKN